MTSSANVSGRVLAAIDPSSYSVSVAEHAAWAATRLAAPLELLHALERVTATAARNLSGNLSLGSTEALLAELAALDERRGKLAQEHGRLLLEKIRTQIAAAYPFPIDVRQRHGALVDTFVEMEREVQLFVLGKRGENSGSATGHLGRNLERVVRTVHRPVLVAASVFRDIERFMIAYDGGPTTRKCIEMVCASALLSGIPCDVLMVGDSSTAEGAPLEWVRGRLEAAGFDVRLKIIAGVPESVIVQYAADCGADLLVMGAYGHSRIRRLIVGSTTTQVMCNCPVSILLLR